MKLRIGCLIILLYAAPAFAVVRIALVASGRAKAENQTLALATADLSGDDGLQLVDRQSINSTLAEQKLNLSGMVDDAQRIQVGKMLKADLFAVVEIDGGDGQALGVVVFDTAGGLRLADAAVSGKPDEAATAITAAVRAAAAKDRTLSDGVRLIGFLPVRNTNLPRDRDIFCDTVRLLLERQLTASPGIAVLERSRLEQLNKERQLPTATGTGNLLPSVVIVQLEISRPPNGNGLRALATLTSSTGQVLDRITAAIDGDSAADLVDRLRDRLIESLRVKPPDHPFGRGEEARRFANDSDILVQNSRFTAGAAAGEAAYALQPSEKNRLILATALWARSWEYLTPNQISLTAIRTGYFEPIHLNDDVLESALDVASRALTLEEESLRTKHHAENNNWGYLDITGGEERITSLDGWCSRLNSVENVPPDIQPRIKEFRTRAMTYILDYYGGWAKSIDDDPSDLSNYNAEMLYALDADASIATSFAAFAAARDQMVHQWIQAFDKHWLPPKELWMQTDQRQSELMTEMFDMDQGSLDTSHWHDFSKEICHQSLGPIAADLNKSTNPVMRLYGEVASALSSPEFTSAAPETKAITLQKFMRRLEGLLDRPGTTPRRMRLYAYVMGVDGIHLLTQGTDSTANAMMDLLDFAVSRKQLIPAAALELILDEPGFSITESNSSDALLRRWLTALQATLDLSQSPDCHVLDANADGVRQKLTAEIHAIHEKFPDLGTEKTVQPWDSAKLLVDLASLPTISQLESASVSRDRIFVLGTGTDEKGGFIQAFELSLGGGSPKPLARTPVTLLADPDNDGDPDGFSYPLVQGAAADDSNFYASVRHQGVVVFPLDGGAAARIDSKHGLATDFAQSLVCEGSNLYIASSAKDGAYLTKWNPKDKSSKVLISSLRTTKRSPLDNTPGLSIEMMANDEPRHRLLLGVAELGTSTKERWGGGLYQLDTTTGRMEHLLSVMSPLSFGEFIGIDHDSFYTANTIWVVQFNLQTDKARYFNFKPGTILPQYVQGLRPDSNTVKGTGWTEPEDAREGDRKVIDGWLWIGQPFGRVSTDAKSLEILNPKLDPNKPPLGAIWTIEPVGTSQIVLGDSNQLYLVNLHKK